MSEKDIKLPETPVSPKTLEEQLAELDQKRSAAEGAEAEYAGLEKLIEDMEKAEAEYEKVFKQFRDDETRLKTEREALSSALEAALGATGVQEVKTTVTTKVDELSGAEENRNEAKTDVEKAQSYADGLEKLLAEKQTELDKWFKFRNSISKQLKTAEGLIEEIKKLRNTGGRREAYWKLALGNHADVPGQEFLNVVLPDEDQVITSDILKENIKSAWDEFKDTRNMASDANKDLAYRKDILKQKEAIYADIYKKLIQAIVGELAKPNASSDAA